MADEQNKHLEVQSTAGEGNTPNRPQGEDQQPPEIMPMHPQPTHDGRGRGLSLSPAPPVPAHLHSASPVSPAPGSLQRSGTLPTNAGHPESEVPDGTRRRGRTISSRPRNAENRPPSPRSQIFARAGSPSIPPGEERMNPIPEGQMAQPPRPSADTGSRRARRSTNQSEQPQFVSPGMRQRVNTVNIARPRGSTLNRVPSVALATGRANTGAAADSQSINYTLAGPAQEVSATVNQPFVDPGYIQLNPAYDQPQNTRPVWGLAKPLPRVLRPGMVPTMSEVNAVQQQQQQQRPPDPATVDLEQGRIEPTLRLGKISSQLQNTRQDREHQLLRTYSRRPTVGGAAFRASSSNIPPHHLDTTSEVVEEGDADLGTVPLPAFNDAGYPSGGPKHYYPDDAASAITEHEEDGDLDGDYLKDTIPLKAYEAEDDEIHNLHTHWSVVRLRYREESAELLAVTVQILLGICSDLVVTVSNSKSGNEATTDWAWGLATMTAIYIAGGISGAHLNPAISIMLYIYRGFPLSKVPKYVFAQLLGAFIAALMAFGLFQNDIIAYSGTTDLSKTDTIGAYITYPRYDYINASTAFFTEFTGTAVLSIAVLALGDDTNAPPGAGMNAFVIGLVVTVCSMAFGYNTGAAMNPSRDLGPRLACLALGYGGALFRNGYWVYGPIVAPILGAIFGAFLYDAAIFVGGESPVNYPRRRLVRAGHKWRVRWQGRIQKAKRRFVRSRGGDDDGYVNGNGKEKVGDAVRI